MDTTTTNPTPPPSNLQAWYSAARPRTLTATYAPLGIAAALAIGDRRFNLFHFVLAFIGALFLQVAANLINEYFDFKRGADEGKVAGQGMTIKNKVLTPNEVLAGAVGTVLAGVAIGLFLLARTGWPLLWIGMGGVFVVVTYTAGPYPLAYNGLGEVAVGIFMGPMMVLGAYFVTAEQLRWDPVTAAIPIMFTVAAILHANNIRDREADIAVNKKTLAVRLGRDGAIKEYVFLMYGAYVALVVLVVLRIMPPTVLVALVTLPEARRLVGVFGTETDPAKLHPAQGQTAKLHGQFGLLIVAGWLAWHGGIWLMNAV
jgi:1,4-dihydroxy-2-naphthoate polyprenyltransferase